jgi:uroporphyrinogen decarboxylase
MTGHERVLTAMNYRQPDRPPIDFGGHRSSGIAAIAYAKLRDWLNLPERPIRVYDPIQQLAVIDDDVLDLFGVDTIELGRGFALEDRDWVDWPLPDGTLAQMPAWALPEREEGQWVYRSRSGKVIAKMPDGALYFEQCYWPFLDSDDLDRLDEAAEETMWSAIASPPGPLIGGPDGDRIFVEGAKRLRERTDRAIIGLFGGNLFEFGQWCYRMDRFLMLLAAEPRRAEEFLDRLAERYLTRLERYLGLVGPYIDVICFGDDLGMQNGPQISTAMYRELFKPRHARMWRRAKELADVKVMLHCCGGVRPLLADLIDAGLDAINPVQITCRGMDAQSLKDEFGGKITFWGGGCDTRSILGSATPDEVAEHVRRQIAILNPGGGFVFQQVHNVLANVPPENVVAMCMKGTRSS